MILLVKKEEIFLLHKNIKLINIVFTNIIIVNIKNKKKKNVFFM